MKFSEFKDVRDGEAIDCRGELVFVMGEGPCTMCGDKCSVLSLPASGYMVDAFMCSHECDQEFWDLYEQAEKIAGSGDTSEP